MRENSIYVDKLHKVIHQDRMYDYEEVSMAFIATKLVQLQLSWNKKMSLVLRSDFINDMTYWFIRYFRSKNIEPSSILSTRSNKEKYPKGVLGIPIVVIEEMNIENTKNSILIIVNRESDKQIFSQKDYREADYGFCFRARGSLQFSRKRGIENYYYIMQNEDAYYRLLDKLEDDESKKSFVEVIRALIENDIYRYNEYKSEIKYFDDKIYKSLGENEVWINCGSCTGDTILHYLTMKKEFEKIYAIEIDKKMVTHLEEMFGLFPQEIKQKIMIYNQCLEGCNSEFNIDYIFKNEKISLINMDIEGAEMTVLEGAAEKIKGDKPVLAIAAYHKPDDLLAIPDFIWKQSSDYHIYFRKYRGYCPDALNEYIYYAVPTERMIRE